ncbi:hypothetical protein D3C75_1184870 [compost metagenome]
MLCKKWGFSWACSAFSSASFSLSLLTYTSWISVSILDIIRLKLSVRKPNSSAEALGMATCRFPSRTRCIAFTSTCRGLSILPPRKETLTVISRMLINPEMSASL